MTFNYLSIVCVQIDEHDSGTESDGVIDVEERFGKFDIGESYLCLV